MAEELKSFDQEEIQTHETILTHHHHPYGKIKTFWPDSNGRPRIYLGPHYPLFLTAYVACLAIIILMLYSYYERFPVFWRIAVFLSSFAFLYSYLRIAISEPGIALPTRTFTVAERRSARFCHICELVRDRRTEHCDDCEVCILDYDHHCPWVGKCVGKNNITQFYCFLASTFGNMIICFIGTSVGALVSGKKE